MRGTGEYDDDAAASPPPPPMFTFVEDSDPPHASTVVLDDSFTMTTTAATTTTTTTTTTAGAGAGAGAGSTTTTTATGRPSTPPVPPTTARIVTNYCGRRASYDECHPMAMTARRETVVVSAALVGGRAAASASAKTKMKRSGPLSSAGGEGEDFGAPPSMDPERGGGECIDESAGATMMEKTADVVVPRIKCLDDESSRGSEHDADGGGGATPSSRQLAAMDRFLAATQLDGNAVAREVAWGELVHAMKQQQQQQQGGGMRRGNLARSSSNGGGGGQQQRHHRGGGRAGSIGRGGFGGGNGGRRGGGAAASGGGGRDDVLGLIHIGGGMRIGAASDVVSIHSGLTSSECETTTMAQHARTATPTDFFPVISMMAGGVGGGGGGMGIGIGGDDPPMVSPISLDGSFDYCTEEEEGGGDEEHCLNVTMESTIATDEEEEEAYRRLSPPVLERRAKSDGDYFARGGKGGGEREEGKEKEIKKKRSPVFFDIGKPFADNAMFPTLADSPVADSSEGATTPSGSARSAREERLGGGGGEGERGPRLPSALPPPSFVSAASSRGSGDGGTIGGDGGASRSRQRTRGAASSRQLPASRPGWVRNGDARVANGASFVAHSIDGEVIMFEEIEDYSGAGGELEAGAMAVAAKFPFYPRPLPPEKELENAESASLSSPRQWSSKRRAKRRGGGGGGVNNNLSLEEHIMNVLLAEEGGGDEEREESFDSPILASFFKSREESGCVVERGTLGSVASAQDILRELTRSTWNAPPLGSISIGRWGNAQGQKVRAGTAARYSPLEDHSIKSLDNSCPTAHKSALALAPSRRDVPRPHRLNRRSASEPHQAAPAALSVLVPNSGVGTSTTTKLKDVPSKPQDAYDSSTKPRNMSISESAVLKIVQVDCSQVDSKDDSPLERCPKVVGISQAGSAPVKFSRLRSIFPKTAPASTIATRNVRAHPPASQFKSNNPFDSPPQCMFTKKMDSSRIPCPPDEAAFSHDVIFSVEPYGLDKPAAEDSAYTSGMCISYSSENTIAPPTIDDLPTASLNSSVRPPIALVVTPSKCDTPLARASSSPVQVPPLSNRSSRPQNDASIFQLKTNAVGGLGKSTSTLVRNDDTGRHVICDVDDNTFHYDIDSVDINFPRVIDKEDEESNNVEHAGAGAVGTFLSDGSYTDRPGQQWNDLNDSHNLFHDTRAMTSIKFMMKNQIMSESVLDDDAVEDAVWAATEGLSMASTTSNDASTVSEGGELHVKFEEHGEKFIVIRKPKHQEWKANWTTFADDDYNFDICPSESKDEWDGGDQWDCKEDKSFLREKVNNRSYFASPTSVAANGRKLL